MTKIEVNRKTKAACPIDGIPIVSMFVVPMTSTHDIAINGKWNKYAGNASFEKGRQKGADNVA